MPTWLATRMPSQISATELGQSTAFQSDATGWNGCKRNEEPAKNAHATLHASLRRDTNIRGHAHTARHLPEASFARLLVAYSRRFFLITAAASRRPDFRCLHSRYFVATCRPVLKSSSSVRSRGRTAVEYSPSVA